MRILVTGHNGMLGSIICDRLKEHNIWGIDYEGSQYGERFLTLDLRDSVNVVDIVGEIKPDVIIHCAGLSNVDACEDGREEVFEINAGCTSALALLAKQHGSLFCYLSTDYVFNGEKRTPYTEGDEANPVNVYGMSKLKGEIAVRDSGCRYLIIRTSWLFGGGKERKHFVNAIIKNVQGKEKLTVVADQMGRPTYCDDLAEAIYRMVEKFKDDMYCKQTFHFANGGPVSWFEFANNIVAFMKNTSCNVLPITTQELQRKAKRPSYSVLDTKKYEKYFNCAIRPWVEALNEYYNVRLHETIDTL